jgi:hypothetical protein
VALPDDVGVDRLDRTGKFPQFDDLDTGCRQELGPFAVYEDHGLSPGEDDTSDAGGKD